MSGICDKCNEHCLDCTCNPNESVTNCNQLKIDPFEQLTKAISEMGSGLKQVDKTLQKINTSLQMICNEIHNQGPNY